MDEHHDRRSDSFEFSFPWSGKVISLKARGMSTILVLLVVATAMQSGVLYLHHTSTEKRMDRVARVMKFQACLVAQSDADRLQQLRPGSTCDRFSRNGFMSDGSQDRH